MEPAILLALDGSALAERAIPPAEALAGALGARLVLVRVAPVTLARADLGRPTEADAARAYLGGVAAGLAARGRAVDTVVRSGAAAEQLVAAARAADAALIVMASRGRGGLQRRALGSVAEGVVAHAPVPVLLVREPGAGPGAALVGGRPRLLVPLDGSAFAEEVLPVAQALAAALGGELLLVRAVPAPTAGTAVDWLVTGELEAAALGFEAEARRSLQRIAARLAAAGCRATYMVQVGTPAEVIAAAERDRGTALTVMTTHGRTGLVRLALGSVADAVVRGSGAPVLLVRPQAHRDALLGRSADPTTAQG